MLASPTAIPAVDLPAALRPPFTLALANASETIPAPGALRGGSLYEPKWDGFRLAIVRDGDTTTLWSRQGKDLTASFPDLAAAAATQIPSGFVLDGEAVIWADGRLDFDRLQRRLVTRGTALTRLVHQHPAVFVGFDLLAAAGLDIRQQPLRTRRALLDALATDWGGPLQLSPATTDLAQAAEWFAALPATGIEDLVIKGRGQPYLGGHRAWVKVKHRDTVELICAAITGTRTRPEELVLGLPIDGRLRIVGCSSPLPAATARALSPHLYTRTGPHPWPAELAATARGGFTSDRTPEPVTLVEPIVVEVSADVALTGTSYRHPVRYVRPRPELQPDDITPLSRAS